MQEPELDIAALEISGALADHKAARFLDITRGGAAPAVDTSIVSRGFPHDLVRDTVDNSRVAFWFVHWANVIAPPDGLENFDARRHLLTPFEGENGSHPRGLSGSAGCWQQRRGDKVWIPDLEIAGVTISFYTQAKIMKLVRRETLEQFLDAHL